MFYAIEYAYGKNVINNGQRADRVLEFTRRELRDAWVNDAAAVSVDTGGYREDLSARSPLVRKAHGLEDGDGEGWKVLADNRVRASVAMQRHYSDIMVYDWPERDHYKWVATAPEGEIVSRAKSVEANT